MAAGTEGQGDPGDPGQQADDADDQGGDGQAGGAAVALTGGGVVCAVSDPPVSSEAAVRASAGAGCSGSACPRCHTALTRTSTRLEGHLDS